MFAGAFRAHRRIQTLNYIPVITSWVSAAAALMPLAPLIPGLLPPQTAPRPSRGASFDGDRMDVECEVLSSGGRPPPGVSGSPRSSTAAAPGDSYSS